MFNKIAAWAGIILFVSLLGLLTDYTFRTESNAVDKLDDGRGSAYWQSRIKSVGGQVAYAELASVVAPFSASKQHSVAHSFSNALYASGGIDMLGVCDDKFGYGCFHSFMGRAIKEHGIDIALKKFKHVCAKEPAGYKRRTCEHGIGHGIVSYFGYGDVAMLAKSLSFCQTNFGAKDFALGCSGGAYMEFNNRSMLSDQEVNPVELTAENTFHPCDSLSSSYAPSCYFWQPLWWVRESFSRSKH